MSTITELTWTTEEFKAGDVVFDTVHIAETSDHCALIGESTLIPGQWLLSVDTRNVDIFGTVDAAKAAAVDYIKAL